MSGRPRMQAEDWAVSAMLFATGGIAGIIAGMVVAMLVGGLWVLVLIALPLFLLQLIFEGGIAGVVYLIRSKIRKGSGSGDPGEEMEPAAPVPWLRDHAFTLGFGLAVAYVLFLGPGFP